MSRLPPTLDTSRGMQRVVAALQNRSLRSEQIAELAFVAITTLTKGGYLRALEAQGLIYVCGWSHPAVSGRWAPIWRAGTGPSMPPPARVSNTEYARRWRHKRGNGLKVVQRQMARLPGLMTMLGGLR